MAGTSLTADQLIVGYDSEPVLKQVSLQVGPGEFIALLGASGCGKTTLLRAISGFVPVSGGSIRVADQDITALAPEKRDMAMVFQSYALWPHMTVAQNIGYGLKLRRHNRMQIRQRVQEMLTMLGLHDLGERKVTQLSGGQRQRVALGRALAVNPRILLLDEPLSNLDARIRQTVRHEIKALQSELGITTIHVTHDREEAMVMADRIVLLHEGQIAQQGTPEEIYNRPASPFVATFLGADNNVPLQLEYDGGQLRIAAGRYNDAGRLTLADDGGVHVDAAVATMAVAHFRSEAAQLLSADEALPDNSLLLRGRIAQQTYPGGFYRYTVAVDDKRFMVDDARRLAVGSAVAISVPAALLHLYPAPASH
jgi:ABC-type Fe3+/spermidine/putrescine transport system ATPase subunit